ncbi:unnamed protein product, partial [Rotaria sp. Silwood2]
MRFGDVIPPHSFDEEPRLMIYDLDHRIRNSSEELHPFDSRVIIHSDFQDWCREFERTRHARWVLLLLLPNLSSQAVIQFVDNYVINRQDLHSFYLIFTNGNQFDKHLRTRFPHTLQWCRSITDKLFNHIQS